MILTTADLRMRDVVRVCDGKKLGCVRDVFIDSGTGRVQALSVLSEEGGFFSCGRELRVGWESILCIGEDTILVSLRPEECCFREPRHCFCKESGKKQKHL